MKSQATTLTISDALLARVGIPRHLAVDLGLILAFSWVVALSAWLSFLLPWTPVAVTGQTFAVLLTGAALGSKRGALSQLAYLAQGAAGLPVFTISSSYGYGGGIARFTGPSGGFLISFVVAAFIVGLLAERGWDRRFWSTAAAMLIGNIVIYVFGVPWLARFFQLSWLKPSWLVDNMLGLDPTGGVLVFALYPYIPLDLIKLTAAALILPSTWTLLSRSRHN